MRSLFAISLLVFTAAVVPSSAQEQASLAHGTHQGPTVGLYFNPIFNRVSNSVADTGVFAFLGSGDTSRFFGGVELGGYYEFLKSEKYTVALDVRDEIMHGNNASLNNFLVGFKVAAQPLAYGLKPYFQVGGGSGRTASPLNPVHITRGEYVVFVGVDKTLGRHVDWRPIEAGYGSLTTVSSSTLGGGSVSIPASTLVHLSTGFVFRFP